MLLKHSINVHICERVTMSKSCLDILYLHTFFLSLFRCSIYFILISFHAALFYRLISHVKAFRTIHVYNACRSIASRNKLVQIIVLIAYEISPVLLMPLIPILYIGITHTHTKYNMVFSVGVHIFTSSSF